MNNLAVINNVSVEFEVIGESVFADTLKIAEVFEKNHQHILRTIKNLPNDDFKTQNFKSSTYLDAQMKPRPCYNLTRDGFSLLVMGFTGEKAYKWKIEFIKAFNIMERQIYDQKLLSLSKLSPNTIAFKGLEEVKLFINDALLADSSFFVPSAYVYSLYIWHCRNCGLMPIALQNFSSFLKKAFASNGVQITKAQKRMAPGQLKGLEGLKPYCFFGLKINTANLNIDELEINGQKVRLSDMNFLTPPTIFIYGKSVVSITQNTSTKPLLTDKRQEDLIRQNERLLIENKKLKRVVSKLKAKNDEE